MYLARRGDLLQQEAGLRVQRHCLGARQAEGGGIEARHVVSERRQAQHVGRRCKGDNVMLISAVRRQWHQSRQYWQRTSKQHVECRCRCWKAMVSAVQLHDSVCTT